MSAKSTEYNGEEQPDKPGTDQQYRDYHEEIVRRNSALMCPAIGRCLRNSGFASSARTDSSATGSWITDIC